MMRPFFKYYGGKWREAPKYPEPLHDVIIEPFAGSAGYAVRHFDRRVVLYDRDPIICGIWNYLITVPPEEILALPDIADDETVDGVDTCQEARWLMGFWVNAATAQPSKRPSAWMRSRRAPGSYWGQKARERIASQVPLIRHWKIVHGSYEDAPRVKATWFVDPPYQTQGKHYAFGSTMIDYAHLARWCRQREGQVIVCENTGADWLPFQHFLKTESAVKGRKSLEAVWLNQE